MIRKLRVRLYFKLHWRWLLPKICTVLPTGDVVMAPWPKLDHKKMLTVQPLSDELRKVFSDEVTNKT